MNKEIYLLIDPRNDEIKYVGSSISAKNRLNYHIKHNDHAKLVRKWIDDLLQNNYKPELLIIDNVEDHLFWEEHYINLYRSFGYTLLNTFLGVTCKQSLSGNKNPMYNLKRSKSPSAKSTYYNGEYYGSQLDLYYAKFTHMPLSTFKRKHRTNNLHKGRYEY